MPGVKEAQLTFTFTSDVTVSSKEGYNTRLPEFLSCSACACKSLDVGYILSDINPLYTRGTPEVLVLCAQEMIVTPLIASSLIRYTRLLCINQPVGDDQLGALRLDIPLCHTVQHMCHSESSITYLTFALPQRLQSFKVDTLN